jgi:serine/threonine protein kinase
MDGKLQFRLYTGEQVEVEAQLEDAETPAGQYLMARKVWLDNGTELRQHRPASGPQRSDGYDRLDNEILAGRRLHEVSELSDWGSYPAELARLYGDEATSADPYTLFDTYLGQPLDDVVGRFLDDEFDAFQVSLLTGLCWLAAAGIAHRAISPDTVLWDSKRRRVQITDFSRSTVFGVPRTPVMGAQGWVPKEQRPRTVYGTVGPRDDVWAAARLIFFVRNQGEDLTDRKQIADSGLDGMYSGLFDQVFDRPEDRPTAWNLLEDGLKRRSPAPRVADGNAWLIAGRERFLQARQRMHPGAVVPPGFNEDIDWMSNPGGAKPPAPGNASSPAATSATSAEATPGRATGRADDTRAESPARAEQKPGETTRSRQSRWRRGD